MGIDIMMKNSTKVIYKMLTRAPQKKSKQKTIKRNNSN